jgi:very-short-patch-repair endonuclease
MTKKEYIKKQISRTNKKEYENYVITRIIHRLNDLDIKFVTQQFVRRPEGRALADLYFPQLNEFVEIDEGQHKGFTEKDKNRDADFISMIGVEPFRIDVESKTIEQINEVIDNYVCKLDSKIKTLKASKEFKAWDIERDFNPEYWIKRGKIRVKDDVAFRTMVSAASCFGKKFKVNSIWKGGVKHPLNPKKSMIWFPKLYINKKWFNEISSDENEIYEHYLKKDKNDSYSIKEHINECLKNSVKIRIVFARVKDNLGFTLYRFKGVFELNVKKTISENNGVYWRRISHEVKTYTY